MQVLLEVYIYLSNDINKYYRAKRSQSATDQSDESIGVLHHQNLAP